MAEGDKDQELAFTGPGGFGARAKNYPLVNVASVILACGIIWGAWELRAHAGEADKQSAAIVKFITEANTSIVNSLKESNQNTVKALEELTREQKKATIQITIGNCMNQPAMKNRADARETCRQIVRDGQ